LHSFDTLGLAEPLLRALKHEGYTTPTPIQTQAIPPVLGGRDLIGLAQTGTGKTAAFALPILHRLIANPDRRREKRCRALVLAPTRELTAQIADSFEAYGRCIDLTVAVVIGGAKPGPQIRAMARGVDVLVATPGRLLDHMTAGAIRLDTCTTVVLDEADHMFDLGFIVPIKRILRALPKERQTLLFSATMPGPIDALAREHLRDPAHVAVTPPAKTADKVDQRVYLVDAQAKRALLADLLRSSGFDRVLVFTRTKRGADKVARHLDGIGLGATAIHGNKSQVQRERALSDFKSGRTPILVATDIAARGIDVDAVSHVINFELPNVPESYVHRIGRTARAGLGGVAISFCDPSERPYLRDIEKTTGVKVPVAAHGARPAVTAAVPPSRSAGAPPVTSARPRADTSQQRAHRSHSSHRADTAGADAGLKRMLGRTPNAGLTR